MKVIISICDERDWNSFTRTVSMPSCWEVWIFILSSENKEVTECRHFTWFLNMTAKKKRHTFLNCLMKKQWVVYGIGINRYVLLLSTFPPNLYFLGHLKETKNDKSKTYRLITALDNTQLNSFTSWRLYLSDSRTPYIF